MADAGHSPRATRVADEPGHRPAVHETVVIGADEAETAEIVKTIYAPLVDAGYEFLITSPEAAELIKYASNAFLAVKLTFINEIALLVDKVGVDVLDVARGIGLDRRIGAKYLHPGPGYGGSCLPKDTNGLLHIARDFDSRLRLVETAVAVNNSLRDVLVERVEKALGGLDGKRIGLLGLAFKADTDDIRESPAIALARFFIDRGARVIAYDPGAMNSARRELADSVEYADSAMAAISDADVAVIATEWPEFAELNLVEIKRAMHGNILADFRNLFDPKTAKNAGLRYIGMGRQ